MLHGHGFQRQAAETACFCRHSLSLIRNRHQYWSHHRRCSSRSAFVEVVVSNISNPSLLYYSDLTLCKYSFYINLPLIGAAGIMIFFVFKTPPFAQHNDDAQASLAEKIRQMDPVGAGLIIAGMACFCLALQWGGITKAWSSADVIGTLVGFGLIVIVFCLWEYSQGSRAMLVPHILKKRPVSVGSIVIFL